MHYIDCEIEPLEDNKPVLEVTSIVIKYNCILEDRIGKEKFKELEVCKFYSNLKKIIKRK